MVRFPDNQGGAFHFSKSGGIFWVWWQHSLGCKYWLSDNPNPDLLIKEDKHHLSFAYVKKQKLPLKADLTLQGHGCYQKSNPWTASNLQWSFIYVFMDYFYWSIIAVQCCVHFCYTKKWISNMQTCILSLWTSLHPTQFSTEQWA